VQTTYTAVSLEGLQPFGSPRPRLAFVAWIMASEPVIDPIIRNTIANNSYRTPASAARVRHQPLRGIDDFDAVRLDLAPRIHDECRCLDARTGYA
jgi:hypothetical protein